ncbi:MAG: hypothetical protein OXC07_06975 [Kistimonas sp.]|nr:hypothetical protein [Kistimonas sp.]
MTTPACPVPRSDPLAAAQELVSGELSCASAPGHTLALRPAPMPTCLTHIHALPAEMLYRVFGYLTLFSHGQCALVCSMDQLSLLLAVQNRTVFLQLTGPPSANTAGQDQQQQPCAAWNLQALVLSQPPRLLSGRSMAHECLPA